MRERVAQQGASVPSVGIEAFAVALKPFGGLETSNSMMCSCWLHGCWRPDKWPRCKQAKARRSPAPAAYLHALTGRGVHVATPNAYLAQRDFELLAPAFRILGMAVGLLPERGAVDLKRAAYLCDVTYAAGYELGFDYLRDQLALRQTAGRELGQTLWARLRDGDLQQPETTQRPLYCAIVDEVDNVLLDDASSPLVLSGAADADAADAPAHQLAHCIASALMPGQHYHCDSLTGNVSLTEAGIHRIHASDIAVPVDVLIRTWTEYVEKSLLAARMFRRDVHYVVRDGAVHIVDASTGRIFPDRIWQDGLHQAIESKEGLRVTAERPALAQITRQRYFRLYQQLCGTTGTAAGCEREFRHVLRARGSTNTTSRPVPTIGPSDSLFCECSSKMASHRREYRAHECRAPAGANRHAQHRR